MPSPETSRRRWPLQLGVALLALTLGVGGALVMVKSAPKAPRKAAERPARLVDTLPVTVGDHAVQIAAMGRVVATREATLYPEVAGRVVAVSERFVPGERLRAGEEILRLEAADYQFAVRQRESALAQAEAALVRELGQQAVAQREYELLGDTLSADERALVLRAPELATAKAAVADARAALERARLDLARTRVTAPFDGIITEKSVALGTRVSSATPLLTLVAVDRFWVRVDLPVDALERIAIPDSGADTGARVRLHRADWPEGVYREGRVLRLVPRLEEKARMAQLLVEVPDPLAMRPENRGLPRLLVNDYLQATIEGRVLRNTVALDRALLHGGDRVWLFAEGQLVVRPVKVLFRGPERVYIGEGLSAGDRVVTTDLSSPIPGMALRTRERPQPTESVDG